MDSKKIYYRKRGFGRHDAFVGELMVARITTTIGSQEFSGSHSVYFLPIKTTAFAGSLRIAKALIDAHVEGGHWKKQT